MGDLKNPYREYSGTMRIADPIADVWDQGSAAGAKAERASIVAWLRWLPLSDVELQYPEALANHLESGAHVKDGETK